MSALRKSRSDPVIEDRPDHNLAVALWCPPADDPPELAGEYRWTREWIRAHGGVTHFELLGTLRAWHDAQSTPDRGKVVLRQAWVAFLVHAEGRAHADVAAALDCSTKTVQRDLAFLENEIYRPMRAKRELEQALERLEADPDRFADLVRGTDVHPC
jgi:hypothetical protein